MKKLFSLLVFALLSLTTLAQYSDFQVGQLCYNILPKPKSK